MNPTLKRIGLTSMLLVAAAFGLAFYFMPPPPPKTVTIAAGREDGAYYAYAKIFAEALAKEGITLKILSTAGSVEALRALRSGRADFAFVQGGTPTPEDDSLRGVATLYYEPLWIFLPRQSPVKTLNQLQGLRVAVGEEGSGSGALARTLLAANGVTPKNSVLLPLDLRRGAKALTSAKADALMGVTAADTPRILSIVGDPRLKLLNCRRAPAYAKRFSYLSVVTLPEGALDLARNLPESDKRLIATTAQLVARSQSHGAIVRLLLRKARAIFGGPSLFADTGTFPTPKYLQFPVHEEAARYFQYGDSWLERHFPFAVATLIARMKIFLLPLLTLLIPLVKGFLPLYRWRIRHQIYRWYRKLKQIDEAADRLPSKALQEELEKIARLQKEVQEHINVPLSYMGEYYLLREHIRLIKEKILARLRHKKEETI